MNNNSANLVNPPVNIKIRLAALWAALMFCYVYGDYFSFYVPGQVEGFISGKTLLNSPGKLLAASVLMLIPSMMVFLSVSLPPGINRILNIVFGVLYTAIMLLIACTSYSAWRTFYVFLAVVESLLTLIIVVQAWKWPKQIPPGQ